METVPRAWQNYVNVHWGQGWLCVGMWCNTVFLRNWMESENSQWNVPSYLQVLYNTTFSSMANYNRVSQSSEHWFPVITVSVLHITTSAIALCFLSTFVQIKQWSRNLNIIYTDKLQSPQKSSWWPYILFSTQKFVKTCIFKSVEMCGILTI